MTTAANMEMEAPASVDSVRSLRGRDARLLWDSHSIAPTQIRLNTFESKPGSSCSCRIECEDTLGPTVATLALSAPTERGGGMGSGL